MPYREPIGSMACPACQGKLVEQELGPDLGTVVCARCGGVWLDHDVLAALLTDREGVVRVEETLAALQREDAADGKTRRLACLRCGAPMRRTWFRTDVAVTIDRCQGHGIWFDRGELVDVLRRVLGPRDIDLGSGGTAGDAPARNK